MKLKKYKKKINAQELSLDTELLKKHLQQLKLIRNYELDIRTEP